MRKVIVAIGVLLILVGCTRTISSPASRAECMKDCLGACTLPWVLAEGANTEESVRIIEEGRATCVKTISGPCAEVCIGEKAPPAPEERGTR